jgi:hypothetical protein
MNGAMSARVSHTYLVTADRPGTFTIPGLAVGGGANAAASRPVVLRVLGSGGSSHAATNRKTPTQHLPNPAVQGDSDASATDVRNGIGFVKLVTPKKEFFVGEVVPVELKAFIRLGAEVRLDGPPQLNSDAFMMQNPGSNPGRAQEVVGGEPFAVFTWSTSLTAVKTGECELTVDLPTTVTVRQRASRPRSAHPFGNSFFDDSFFDQFFGSATQKQMKFSSAKVTTKVMPLPAGDRPGGFTGTVGQFEINAGATPATIAVGDPITLKVTVIGRGNFDRVNVLLPDQADDWKTYKPGTKFEPADSVGFAGKKTFDFALISQKPGTLEIAPIEFSFFDPETRRYVTRTTQSLTAEVTPPTGNPGAVARQSPTAPGDPQVNLDTGHEAPVASIPPPRLVPTNGSGSQTRMWRWSLLLLLPGVGCGGFWLLRRWRTLNSDPTRFRTLALRQSICRHIDRMESAATRGESAEFFTAARCALRECLGERFNLRPEAITLAEINLRLNGNGDALRPIFALADEVIFTGRSFSPQELLSWSNVVNSELKKLEAV